ncbi:MAG: prepilin-type N-terminal cleavage/methylation domain-containing protein [Candidatus Harrisonbacteria bacterium]|nr:prepilin-type N-terminal cleavage/methylation domain-containing protein [Candidatus Harrisonbacteria bacterium]
MAKHKIIYLVTHSMQNSSSHIVKKSGAVQPSIACCTGFTLIEILLYVAITAIIFGGMIAFIDGTFKSRIQEDVTAEVEMNGNMAMSVMAQMIRNAKSIASPAASSTATSLTLVMPDANINPVVFELLGGAIQMSERGAATTTLTSSRVTAPNLFFTNLSRVGTPGAVGIRFVLDYANPDGMTAYDYRARFFGGASLRNN